MMWCFVLDLGAIVAMLNMLSWFKAKQINNNAQVSAYLSTTNYVKHDGEKPTNII